MGPQWPPPSDLLRVGVVELAYNDLLEGPMTLLEKKMDIARTWCDDDVWKKLINLVGGSAWVCFFVTKNKNKK